ncbi:MFS general substrate transporter [Aulographum hederae CBS 113979]|uniref:MFS general substrate transporter n=1 Tax=Aulographum hederae CBS 113979 TaxID=1176131 RepID=A0A6G1GR23_9PEZI|nr:MFS general substrate transporter [Aulographum hederae CBS 113979]
MKTGPDLEAIGEQHGYVTDLELLSKIGTTYKNVKLANDGHTVLIPQPSEDPHDPLNWSWTKKHLILLCIAATSFLPDNGSAVGAVTLIPQSHIWGLSEDYINHSQVGNVFMLGAGGIFTCALSTYFGRLPVLFWFTMCAVWTAAWCAGAAGFEDFMAARILNGFFSTVAQSGGLMFIKDMFFHHEHARKINIWGFILIVNPYFGPLITSFIIDVTKWQWAFGVYTIETGLCFILTILAADETYYNRRIPREQRIAPKSRWLRLIGIEQWKTRHQRSTFGEAWLRLVRTLLKPTLFISAFYYLFTFAWVVGINTTLAIFLQKDYEFGPRQIGFFYFAPIVAALLGEAFGHWIHDLLARVLTMRNKGTFIPEFRLAALWISTPFMVVGLVLLGYSLERKWHYMVAAVSWGLYVFGTMITTVGITAYNLDSYPEGSGEVAAWLNMSRILGGFIISYFQVKWAESRGTIHSFGTQAAVCGGVFVLVIFLQMFGEKIRRRSGPLHFKVR